MVPWLSLNLVVSGYSFLIFSYLLSIKREVILWSWIFIFNHSRYKLHIFYEPLYLYRARINWIRENLSLNKLMFLGLPIQIFSWKSITMFMKEAIIWQWYDLFNLARRKSQEFLGKHKFFKHDLQMLQVKQEEYYAIETKIAPCMITLLLVWCNTYWQRKKKKIGLVILNKEYFDFLQKI